jgi:hypothetical protein
LADNVSAVSEANGTTVPVSLDLRSSLSNTAVRRKPLAGAADAECYGNSIDFCLKSLARQGLWAKRLLFMLIDVERLAPKAASSYLRHHPFLQEAVPLLVFIHAAASAARAASF